MTESQVKILAEPVLSDRRLTLNLVLSDDGDVDVRSCEVISRSFRNRTTFPDFHKLEQVIVDKLALAVRRLLKDLPSKSQVLSLPDFVVELPGLVLSGLHLLIMDMHNGRQNAILRFKEFLGSVNFMFLEDIGFQGSVTAHNERLATSVLTDICLPLLNLCNQMEFVLRDAGQVFPENIKEHAGDLEFRTELLKRFVFNSGTGNPSAPDNYLESDHALPAALRHA